MEQLTVQLPSAAYPVYIGRGLLARAGALLREEDQGREQMTLL